MKQSERRIIPGSHKSRTLRTLATEARQTSMCAKNKEPYSTRWLIISYVSAVGWQFLCWRGENRRNFSHAEETESFPQVRFESHSLWAHNNLPVMCVYWLYMYSTSVSLHALSAVMTSYGGTCLSCCLLSCQWRAAREEHRLRYQHSPLSKWSPW